MYVRLFVGALAALAVACDPGVRLGTRCDLTSECPPDLVCRHERCRVACAEARDCGPGLRCVAGGDGVLVCTVAPEESCGSDGDCPQGLSCVVGECRTTCADDSECTTGGRCVAGSCAEPASGEDGGAPSEDAGVPDAATDAGRSACGAPLVCGDGVLQGCSTQGQLALLRTIVGSDVGELALLAPHEFAPTTIPREGTQLVRSQVTIAGTASGGAPGIGLVAWIDGGATEEERTLAIRRFPLDDLTTATAPAGFGDVRRLRSVALAEDGSSITGVFVPTQPGVGGETGAWITYYAGDLAFVYPLSSGAPPSSGSGRLAIVGGASAMLATSFDLFHVFREDPPATFSGSMILGAVDRARSMTDYRAISTAGLSADPWLESAGGPGNVVVVADPTLFGLAAWQPRRTTPVSMLPGGTTVDDLPPIQHLGVSSSELAGPPTLALADDTGLSYVVGFPASEGGARFLRMVCPRTADCALPLVELARTASVVGGPTHQVRLARLRAGYAYAELASMLEGPRVVHLSFLDEEGAQVPPFDPGDGAVPGSLLGARGGDGSSEVVSDVAIHAVRGGGAVTILVAALIRDETLRLDRVWIGGLRACEAR